MPKRLDPEKGLPGLFSPSRAKSSDMTFLVRSPGGKRSARAKKPAPEKPTRARRRPARPPLGAKAPPVVATSATDASPLVPVATTTVALEPPILVTVAPVPSADQDLARELLREAGPPYRVPDPIPAPDDLTLRDALGFARCAFEWTLATARTFFLPEK
jgi:hypothetical protein